MKSIYDVIIKSGYYRTEYDGYCRGQSILSVWTKNATKFGDSSSLRAAF